MQILHVILLALAVCVSYMASRPAAAPTQQQVLQRYPLRQPLTFRFASEWPAERSSFSRRLCRVSGSLARCNASQRDEWLQRVSPARWMLRECGYEEVQRPQATLLWLSISLDTIGMGRDVRWSEVPSGVRVNRFPGIEHLNRKDSFALSYRRRQVPEELRFHPHTIVLPAESETELGSIRFPAVLKPAFGGKGKGIEVLQSARELQGRNLTG